jgi:hypothetical protein
VALQLALDRRPVVHRIRAIQRREVEHVHEQTRPLDMCQEVVPEAGAVAGAFDEAGDVGQHELALVGLQRPQHRLEGGERIVGDLGGRPREAREQRGLAGVGQPDQADVGQQLQVQMDPTLLAAQAALGEARCLTGGRGKALVAVPAQATAREDHARAGHDEVIGGAFPVDGLRSRWDPDDEIAAVSPVA